MMITMINSFVHVCMYGYYMLSVYDKKFKTSVTLKRKITELQLVSFNIVIMYTLI